MLGALFLDCSLNFLIIEFLDFRLIDLSNEWKSIASHLAALNLKWRSSDSESDSAIAAGNVGRDRPR